MKKSLVGNVAKKHHLWAMMPTETNSFENFKRIFFTYVEACRRHGIIHAAESTGPVNLFGRLKDMTMVDVRGDGNCLFRVAKYHMTRLRRLWELNHWKFPERVREHGHEYNLPNCK